MKHDGGDIGWWLDTSALTPEESAEQIVREKLLFAVHLCEAVGRFASTKCATPWQLRTASLNAESLRLL